MDDDGSGGRIGNREVRMLSDAALRLGREFSGAVHPHVISTVVRRSHDELDCPSDEALPELVERLARVRLLEQVAST